MLNYPIIEVSPCLTIAKVALIVTIELFLGLFWTLCIEHGAHHVKQLTSLSTSLFPDPRSTFLVSIKDVGGCSEAISANAFIDISFIWLVEPKDSIMHRWCRMLWLHVDLEGR